MYELTTNDHKEWNTNNELSISEISELYSYRGLTHLIVAKEIAVDTHISIGNTPPQNSVSGCKLDGLEKRTSKRK